MQNAKLVLVVVVALLGAIGIQACAVSQKHETTTKTTTDLGKKL